MERRGKPLAQYEIDQIRKFRREGLSIRGIERLTGVAKCTVEKYCKGLPVPGQPKPPVREPRLKPDPEGDITFEAEYDEAVFDPFLNEYEADD